MPNPLDIFLQGYPAAQSIGASGRRMAQHGQGVAATVLDTIAGANSPSLSGPQNKGDRREFIMSSIANALMGGNPSEFYSKYKEGLRAQSQDDLRRQMFEAQMRHSADEAEQKRAERSGDTEGADAFFKMLKGGPGAAAFGAPRESEQAGPKMPMPQAAPVGGGIRLGVPTQVDQAPSEDYTPAFPKIEDDERRIPTFEDFKQRMAGGAPPASSAQAGPMGILSTLFQQAGIDPSQMSPEGRVALAKQLQGMIPNPSGAQVYGEPEGSMTEREAWNERRAHEENLTGIRAEAGARARGERRSERDAGQARRDAAAQAAAQEQDLKELLGQAREDVSWASRDVNTYQNEHPIQFMGKKGAEDPAYLTKKDALTAAEKAARVAYGNLVEFQKTRPTAPVSGQPIAIPDDVVRRMDESEKRARVRLGLK